MFDNFILQNTKTGNQVEFNFEDGETPTPSSDVSSSTATFTEASTRTNILTGETLSVIFGKIKKFFADLKTVAFSGSYNDLTDTPTIPTVNNATLTIKQGGTTKGTFTANASTDVEIDLDAGGGSTYTAGTGISITNNVISVTTPIVKNSMSLDSAVIPCLFLDSSASTLQLTLENGTVATLADCLDLGESSLSSLDLSSQVFRHWENVSYSGTGVTYDYSTATSVSGSYSASITDGTSLVNALDYNLFDECVQIVQGAADITDGSVSGTSTVQIVIGKANGHLYAFVLNQYWQSLSTYSYLQTCTLNGDFDFLQI